MSASATHFRTNGRYELVNTATFCGSPEQVDPKDPTVPHIPDERQYLPWRGPFAACQQDRD